MAKKTARPEMTWIPKREQWRKRIIVDGRSRDVYGKTQDEVRERVKAIRQQQESGLVLGDSTTLAQFAKEWYPIKTAGLRPATRQIYSNAINNHLAPLLGNLRLSDIKTLHVRKLMAQSAKWSRSLQSKVLFTLRQIMDAAKENGLVQKNPCEGIRPGGAPAKPKTPLTRAQQSTLADAVKGTRAELFVLLCLYAGLRREEALGLMWSSVHLDGDVAYIDVRHTVTLDGGQPIHTPDLKSKAAYRSIPIPPVLAESLKAHKAQAKSLLVIPAVSSRGAMSLAAFRRMWDKVTGYQLDTGKKDADGKKIRRFVPGVVDFHVEPHILRHTYLTELCASGMDIKKIQYLAGHEDVTMTLRVYTHVTQNRPEDMSESILKIFPGSAPGSSEKAGT